MVYTIPLGNQWPRVYTIGPNTGVYTIEAADPEKEKGEVSTVVVCTFFSPENPNSWVWISSGGVGVFHVKGWGAKKFGMSLEAHGNQAFERAIP